MTATFESVQEIIEKTGQSWTPTTKDNVLPDEIIDAYQAGKKNMLSEIITLAAKGFLTVLQKAMKSTSSFREELQSKNIDVSDIFLKVDSISSFEAAFIIPDKVYLSNEQLDLISRAAEIEEILEREESLVIEFRFLPNRSTLNHKRIISNGFTLKYDPKQTSA